MTADGDLRLDGSGAVTTFVCAGYDYDHEVAQPLLSLLPRVLHVPADGFLRAVGASRACAHTRKIVGLLTSRPRTDRACSEIFGGPERAVVTGLAAFEVPPGAA